jgi:hypothetical protein
LVYMQDTDEGQYLYWVRLTAYLLIVFAILDKNRPSRTRLEKV